MALRSRAARHVFAALAVFLTCLASDASAQDTEKVSIGPVVRRVFLDPTTYAPAIVAYDATMLDWNSSESLFQTGLFAEHNPRFTISGRPDDLPVDYATGRRQIMKDSLTIFEISATHNAANALIERILISKHPAHQKAFRVLATVERIAFASAVGYYVAAPHYRQWQKNNELAAHFVGVSVALP